MKKLYNLKARYVIKHLHMKRMVAKETHDVMVKTIDGQYWSSRKFMTSEFMTLGFYQGNQ